MLPLEVDEEPHKARPYTQGKDIEEEEDEEALLSGRRSAWRQRIFLTALWATVVVVVCVLIGGGTVLYLAVSAEISVRNSIQGEELVCMLVFCPALRPAVSSTFERRPRELRMKADTLNKRQKAGCIACQGRQLGASAPPGFDSNCP
jgi:hypothetical protein